MVSTLLYDPTCLLAMSVVMLSLLWWLSTRRPPGLPPGPGPALPLLGHLYLQDKDPRRKFHEWRRQYGDVFSLYMGGRLVVVLCGYDVIKETFVKLGDVFSDHPPMFLLDVMSKRKDKQFEMALTALLDPTWLPAVSAVVLSLLWWLLTRRPPGLPPGPGFALPLIGHLYLLDKDPRPKFHEWRHQYGDVFSLYIGGRLVVVLCGYDAIKEAFVKFADAFSNRPHTFLFDTLTTGKGVGGSSGPEWKKQRKTSLEILRELGMGKNVLAERIQEEVAMYIKALNSRQGKATDITRLTQASICNNICSIIFGRRYEYDDPAFLSFLQKTDENLKALGVSSIVNCMPWLANVPGDPFLVKRTRANLEDFDNLLAKPQVKAHEDSYNEADISDFIHAYIREIRKHEQNGQGENETTIDNDHLVSVIGDLFTAGTDTTASSIRWAVAFFLHNPEVQDKCFDEIQRVVGTERAPSMRDRPDLTYIEATIMEILRLGNIVPLGIPHGCTGDVKFRGFTIPGDAIVVPFAESVLLDPQVWDQPDAFRPDRFIAPDGKLNKPDELIPFSIGRRVCLGESLARMELYLYLTTMIQHFRFLPPEDGQLPSLEGDLGITLSPKPYRVRVVARQ